MQIEDSLLVDSVRANIQSFVKKGLVPRFERILDEVKTDFRELLELHNQSLEESKRKNVDGLEFNDERIREIYDEVINEIQD